MPLFLPEKGKGETQYGCDPESGPNAGSLRGFECMLLPLRQSALLSDDGWIAADAQKQNRGEKAEKGIYHLSAAVVSTPSGALPSCRALLQEADCAAEGRLDLFRCVPDGVSGNPAVDRVEQHHSARDF